jgi:hypothetical protein
MSIEAEAVPGLKSDFSERRKDSKMEPRNPSRLHSSRRDALGGDECCERCKKVSMSEHA